MHNLYLPEGRLVHTPENEAACASFPALRQAMAQNTILEGRAMLATPEHDLIVSFGPFTGRIPREETAQGIQEGTTREIAILSRVGKPVSFCVSSLGDPEDPQIVLSRRKAQELAFDHCSHCPPGTILPATVTHLDSFGAFVDLGCGLVSMIGIENCSVSRLSHTACRFTEGQEIFVVLTGCDPSQHRIFLSHKELLGTWSQNAAQFSPGMTVPGWVRGIKPYGTFIELTPNLTGLADPTEDLKENDRVSVYIKSILPDRMKVKLSILHKLEPWDEPAPIFYFTTQGQLDRWDYVPASCPRRDLNRSFSAVP